MNYIFSCAMNCIYFLLQEGMCHEGSKACKAVYCGDTGLVFTTGFSRFSDRQYGVWDEKNLNTPLRLDNIDSSSGVLTPFYDHDTRVVFVAGKVCVHLSCHKRIGEKILHYVSYL